MNMGRPGEGNRDGENVLCPLFMSYKENTIKCQAHIPEASSVEIKYSNTRACTAQRQIYCEGNWKRCEQYLAWIHFRWEEDE